MKKTKRNSVLIILIVLLLALAVGYAAFQQVLTISGTASASGDWDIKFTAASITEDYGEAKITGTSADTVSVNATLGFPGDGCEVETTISNQGDLNAVLTSVEILDDQGKTYNDEDIKITLPTGLAGEDLDAGDDCKIKLTIVWDKDSEVKEKEVNFQIKFTYDQKTTAADVEPSHVH